MIKIHRATPILTTTIQVLYITKNDIDYASACKIYYSHYVMLLKFNYLKNIHKSSLSIVLLNLKLKNKKKKPII